MILTCPSCATRYQADASKFPAAGRSVRCAKCGHVWHQLGPAPEPEPDADVVVEGPPAPAAAEPAHQAEPASEAEPEPRVAAFAPTPSVAVHHDEETTGVQSPEHAVVAPAAPAASLLGRGAIVGGWVLLVALILVIGWSAVSFRDSIATWVPQTSTFYSAAGLPVSPRGLALVDVAYDSQPEDGQQVLAVTGKVVNRSNHELNVPLVMVSLFDRDHHELYHWTFVPGVSILKPGEVARFRTRLSSPPGGTHSLEVRFARAGE
ncbi:MAG TPA: DUF3426 domain-containing protein [Rhizomicrobium sp.]|nr:DUF3426 domain-containing protein [Rhizomicrobium sp.]